MSGSPICQVTLPALLNPSVVADWYLEAVRDLGGCPAKIRTDCGTENGMVAAAECNCK